MTQAKDCVQFFCLQLTAAQTIFNQKKIDLRNGVDSGGGAARQFQALPEYQRAITGHQSSRCNGAVLVLFFVAE
ncbi:hypothetical protein IMCC9480_2823 [Oxalobacteraceae bacterium IMCC9480]|nr:hypothetical protein IMCC9480_2823 [Oxalobacteraceae bacterium IMCC9480]NDP58389.1 hypothetical protein [Oxalobacteraceae bacterium]